MTFTNLTIKNRSWKWNEDEQMIFEKLRDIYLSNLVLKLIDISSSIIIEIDAFDLIIEVCFSYQINDKWYFETYFSRKLLLIEQNYDIHNKKLLIIITALKH